MVKKIEKLGSGAIGIVYRYQSANHKIAVKHISIEIGNNETSMILETAILKRLHHPNIMRILDVVEESINIII